MAASKSVLRGAIRGVGCPDGGEGWMGLNPSQIPARPWYEKL